jgi:hypothetical protein
MLEILFVVYFSGKIANIAKENGYKTGGYRALAVILWFIGEFIGLAIGIVFIGGIGSYAIGILGAISGALTSYLIVKGLPEKAPVLADSEMTRNWICPHCGYKNNCYYDKEKCYQCHKPRE